jgi:ABC-type branched-subunit amino acid transport system substrate-binding protein
MRLFAVALALALVAAACGGTEDTTTTAAQETTTTAAQETTTTAGEEPEAAMKTGIGVDAENMVIKLGALHDLTGAFAPLVVDINDAMKVYYDKLNAAGGIDGWTIEYILEDTNYNVEQHLEKYEKVRGEVLALTASTGSPTTVAALQLMIEDNMTFIPLSWYSGWAIPEFDGGLALEQATNYCIEAMNILDFINDNGGKTIAIATFPGDYGGDAAAGVRLGAEFYGMEVVYDGEGKVIPGQDQTEVVTAIVESGADWAFITTNPTLLAELMGGAVQAGYQGMWTGSSPSYNFALLDSPVGPIIDQVFYQSGYNTVWGSDAAGQVEMEEAMKAAFPDRRPSDAFIIGWNEAVTMTKVLEQAIANGDLTREGVKTAVAQVTSVEFNDSMPNQSYAGTPNDYVTRQSVIYNPDLATYLAAGGPDQTLSQEDGTTGSLVERDFFVSEAAKNFDFTSPCFEL